jgi:hypothetical protein
MYYYRETVYDWIRRLEAENRQNRRNSRATGANPENGRG